MGWFPKYLKLVGLSSFLNNDSGSGMLNTFEHSKGPWKHNSQQPSCVYRGFWAWVNSSCHQKLKKYIKPAWASLHSLSLLTNFAVCLQYSITDDRSQYLLQLKYCYIEIAFLGFIRMCASLVVNYWLWWSKSNRHKHGIWLTQMGDRCKSRVI